MLRTRGQRPQIRPSPVLNRRQIKAPVPRFQLSWTAVALTPISSSGSEPDSLRQLFAVEREGFEHRAVADREEDRVLAAGVLVRMLRPRGKRDDVALLPVERLAVDDSASLAAHHVEDRAAAHAACLQLL